MQLLVWVCSGRASFQKWEPERGRSPPKTLRLSNSRSTPEVSFILNHSFGTKRIQKSAPPDRFQDGVFPGIRILLRVQLAIVRCILPSNATFTFSGDFTGPMNYIRCALRRPDLGATSRRRVTERVPTLLIWGTRDGALSQQLAEKSRDCAADMRLVYIEGASHWVQQDEPELVNKYIWSFVRGEKL